MLELKAKHKHQPRWPRSATHRLRCCSSGPRRCCSCRRGASPPGWCMCTGSWLRESTATSRQLTYVCFVDSFALSPVCVGVPWCNVCWCIGKCGKDRLLLQKGLNLSLRALWCLCRRELVCSSTANDVQYILCTPPVPEFVVLTICFIMLKDIVPAALFVACKVEEVGAVCLGWKPRFS